MYRGPCPPSMWVNIWALGEQPGMAIHALCCETRLYFEVAEIQGRVGDGPQESVMFF